MLVELAFELQRQALNNLNKYDINAIELKSLSLLSLQLQAAIQSQPVSASTKTQNPRSKWLPEHQIESAQQA